MARPKTKDTGVVYEPLKARITYTDGDHPVTLAEARTAYGESVMVAPRGWFWVFATPRTAADIRRRGLRAVGKLTQTWIPPQDPGGIVHPDAKPEDVPCIGTSEHISAMFAECLMAPKDRYPDLGDAELANVVQPGPGHFESEAPENSGIENAKLGPLRKTIVFRLARVDDDFPLVEETTDPKDLPTLREWLDEGAPMREIREV